MVSKYTGKFFGSSLCMQEMTKVHSAYTKKKKTPINNSQLLINKYYFKTFRDYFSN
jgi:hypothetical protein